MRDHFQSDQWTGGSDAQGESLSFTVATGELLPDPPVASGDESLKTAVGELGLTKGIVVD